MNYLEKRNQFFYFFSLLGAVFGILITGSIYTPAITGIYIAFISSIILYFSVKHINSSKFLIITILVSTILKIIVVHLMENILIKTTGIPFLSYKDDYVYNEVSSTIVEAWRVRGIGFYDDIRFATGYYSGYPTFSAAFKAIFGDNYLVPRYMNVVFSSLTIPFFYKSLKFYTREKESRLITLIFAFSSVFVIYCSLQLKDTILIFFLSVMIYGILYYYVNGFNIQNAIYLFISIIFMVFFRAGILIPFIVSLILTTYLSNPVYKSKFSSLTGITSITLLIILTLYLWEELNRMGLLNLSGEEYFQTRLSIRADDSIYEGSNSLSNIGPLQILAGPLIAFFSLFLPTPVYLDLDEEIKINYHYLPTLEYYSIIPMTIIAIIFIIKHYKNERIGLFIVIFLLLYKLVQAGGKSIFDSRQSLPAIYSSYLLLGYFNLNIAKVKILWKKNRYFIILSLVLVMFSFSFIRWLIRQ